jgi:type IV secretory pathway protease TraF
VRVLSRRGLPVSGALVTFRLAEGEGALEPASALSDADGRARTSWTLGGLPGSQSLIATVQHLDSTIVLTAEADPLPADTRAMAVVEHPRGAAAQTLADPVELRITDSSGRVLPDVPVSWHPLDGAVEPLAPRTDSAGIARARWTLGPAVGTQRLRAQVGSARGGAAIPPVTFTATAIAGAPARILVLAGDRQRGPAGAPLRPVVVRVLDAAGNGVADAALLISVASGTLLDTLVRTDSTGRAALHWTLGRSAGSYTLAVHLDGLAKSLDVAALAQPGAPANLDLDEVHSSAARSGQRKLVATVTDLYGNLVPNAKLKLTATGGRVSPSRAVSDARGAVPLTWTPGSGATLSGAIVGTDVRETYALHVGPAVHQAGAPMEPSATAKLKAKAKPAVRGRR